MKNRLLLLAAAAACALAASDTASASAAPGPQVVVATIGDTTVVRTLSGSVWEGGGDPGAGGLDRRTRRAG